MKKSLVHIFIVVLLGCSVHAESMYIVAPKDTLYKIAKEHAVTVEALQAYNQLKEGEQLIPGMLLKIPEAGENPVAKTTAKPTPKPDSPATASKKEPVATAKAPTPASEIALNEESPKPALPTPKVKKQEKPSPKPKNKLAELPRPQPIESTSNTELLVSQSSNLHEVTVETTPNLKQAPSKNFALEQRRKKHKQQLASRSNQSLRYGLLGTATSYIGTPYVMGGTSRNGIDCSAFTMRVFEAHGSRIPRTADAQYYAAKPVSWANAQAGDLVFFETYLPGPSHVGIYMGNGQFIHASSSRGVTVSKLSNSYWSPRFLGFRRY